MRAAAKLSEQNAKASETAAKASEAAAAESASAAQQSATSAAESAAVYDDVVADVNQLKQDLDELDSRLSESIVVIENRLTAFDGFLRLPVFEVGNISGSSGKYTNSKYRVRTKEGEHIVLNAGDIIHFSDYTDLQYMVRWTNNDGVSKFKAWLTNDFTILEHGEYVLCIKHDSDTIAVTVDDFVPLLSIYRPKNIVSDVELVKNRSRIRSSMKFGAHQGAKKRAPENSYPAFIKAGEEGWEYLWIAGIRHSADNTWYVMHDETVDRTTNGTGNFSDMTDAQIENLRIDYQPANVDYAISDFVSSELRVPTLSNTIRICNRYGMKMCIRLGSLSVNVVNESQVVRWNRFIDIIQSCDWKNQIYSGSVEQMTTLRNQLEYDVEACLYISPTATADDIISEFARGGITTNRSCIIHIDVLSKEEVRKLHKNDIKVYAYTQYATDEELINASKWGVDIFQNEDKYMLPSDYRGF